MYLCSLLNFLYIFCDNSLELPLEAVVMNCHKIFLQSNKEKENYPRMVYKFNLSLSVCVIKLTQAYCHQRFILLNLYIL